MARVRICDPPRPRFVDAEESGDEAAELLATQLSIRVRQQTRWPRYAGGMRVQHGLDDGDDDGGSQAVSGSITNEDAPTARIHPIVVPLIQREKIVQVSAGAACRLVTGRDL